MTYFTSLNYTNYTLVTDWFVAGNEIADHTSVTIFYPPSFNNSTYDELTYDTV